MFWLYFGWEIDCFGLDQGTHVLNDLECRAVHFQCVDDVLTIKEMRKWNHLVAFESVDIRLIP